MSLSTTTRSLIRGYKARFPGATDSDIAAFAVEQYKISVANPALSVKDGDLHALADKRLDEAASNGEPWALALKNSVRDNVVKPIVEKAKAAGVDPVPAIVLQAGLSEAEATAMVASLADLASSGDISIDEADLDEVDGSADGSADIA